MDAFLALHPALSYLAALMLAMAMGFGWAFGNAFGAWTFGQLTRSRSNPPR